MVDEPSASYFAKDPWPGVVTVAFCISQIFSLSRQFSILSCEFFELSRGLRALSCQFTNESRQFGQLSREFSRYAATYRLGVFSGGEICLEAL